MYVTFYAWRNNEVGGKLNSRELFDVQILMYGEIGKSNVTTRQVVVEM